MGTEDSGALGAPVLCYGKVLLHKKTSGQVAHSVLTFGC